MINWDERINYAPKPGERFIYLGKVMEAKASISSDKCRGCNINPEHPDCWEAPHCLTHDVIFVEVKEQK